MRQSTKSVVAAIAMAVALCLTAFGPSSTMASPIGIPNSPQQSSFDVPINKQTICGTVIAIDYGVDEFSVGYINPTTNEHELFPNNEGETSTASFVRIIDHFDGTQDILIGKDAVLRPLDAREMAVVASKKLKQDQYYLQNPTNNYSAPIPEYMYDFRPNVAYGLGESEAIRIRNEDKYRERWLKSSATTSKFVNGEFIIVGDEWEGFSGKTLIRSFEANQTGQCVISDAERDWQDQMSKKRYEQKQMVKSLLMGRAKELAETRLQKGTVKFAVVVIPSLSIGTPNRPQLETTIDAAVRVGLETVRVLENSEASVLAYEPEISREEAIAGRPQRIVMYYLNSNTEGITVFEASRAQSSGDKDEGVFLSLKELAKYHFYQSVERRMKRALAKRMFERYTAGEYHTDENSPFATGVDAERPTHPITSNSALSWLNGSVQRPQWARMWGPETGDVQEQFWVSAYDYILFSHQEWWDFEREFLKMHYRNMLERAYEKSGVMEEERPAKLDLFLVVDQSQFRNMSSGIMMEALGGGIRELCDPAIAPERVGSYGAARLAEYLTKQSSHSSCT
ncbi:hypothetical protein K457DRAFT_134331 [Linnemannia elongata AG-77]|uniref:Actin-like ATPase domain-containing protein n=1 Tax=Linnemannia elongata AG-77 TaxID=1314771 RepID=A0A197K8K0_9FUNG|nr:hypothetical protein K457DRAFT_134331 [Linnemannia elongata AG-77]